MTTTITITDLAGRDHTYTSPVYAALEDGCLKILVGETHSIWPLTSILFYDLHIPTQQQQPKKKRAAKKAA